MRITLYSAFAVLAFWVPGCFSLTRNMLTCFVLANYLFYSEQASLTIYTSRLD